MQDLINNPQTPLQRTLKLTEIEQRVCDLASEQLAIPRNQVRPSSRLIEDLHCDSVELIELFLFFEEVFAVTIPTDPPNAVLKSVFTRQSFCLRDLAEMIYLQQGTGKPARRGWRNEIVGPVAKTTSIPFTQLDGRWDRDSFLESAMLLDPLPWEGKLSEYRRRSDGMRCILIPSDVVEIGSIDPDAHSDEHPVHEAELDPFLIDAEPVSTTAFCRFLNSIIATEANLIDWFLLDLTDKRRGQMPVERIDGIWQPVAGVEHFPMVLVSWYGANAYSLWANGRHWAEYRESQSFLPTEAQWEYAARGRCSQPFPWGAASDSQGRMQSAQHERGQTYQAETLPMAAVNERLGMSPFGLHHMAGNIWQWCQDWYDADFYRCAESTGKNPVNRKSTGVRSERGGS